MSPGRTSLAAAGAAVVVVALDQISKGLVRDALELGERHELVAGVRLVNVRNSGIAFGFLSGGGALLVVGTAIALLALVFFFVTHTGRPLVWLPTGLMIGGAIGNLIDRARYGEVTDFIKFPHWPVFNVADSAISVGVVTVVLFLLFGDTRDERTAAER